jgi:acetyltransferase-like isoleucine patch superfamily enzyme
VKKYNDYFPDDATDYSLAADRDVMLKNFIGHVGKDVCIDPPFQVDYGCNIIIGDGFYANFKCVRSFTAKDLQATNFEKKSMVILDCAMVTIGDRVKFGPNVGVFAATHPIEVQERRESPDYSKEVTIGNDCWIGGNSVIMPGVRIGDGVTVGANSVVTRDIPSFSVAVGSPARVIKKIKPV